MSFLVRGLDKYLFNWCVTWFCGNGYNEALTEMEDYKIMEVRSNDEWSDDVL